MTMDSNIEKWIEQQLNLLEENETNTDDWGGTEFCKFGMMSMRNHLASELSSKEERIKELIEWAEGNGKIAVDKAAIIDQLNERIKELENEKEELETFQDNITLQQQVAELQSENKKLKDELDKLWFYR